MKKLRRVTEPEVISEFLKNEFYQEEFQHDRDQFERLVLDPDLTNEKENAIRRALLFRRRGHMWRELPADTEWWQVELRTSDLPRIRVFPRNHWRKLASGNFYLTEMVDHIRARVGSHPSDAFVAKLRSLSDELASAPEHDSSVLLIGLDEESPLTIIEGNHRMAAASLVSPQEIHLRIVDAPRPDNHRTTRDRRAAQARAVGAFAGDFVRVRGESTPISAARE